MEHHNSPRDIRDVIKEGEEGDEDSESSEGKEMKVFYENSHVTIGFNVKHRVDFGKAVYVAGSIPVLGNWCPRKAVRLTWSEGHKWFANVKVRGEKNQLNFKYKYFVSDFEMVPESVIVWEPGMNRNFVDNFDYKFAVHLEDMWGFIKIVFRFATSDSIHGVYLAGDLFKIGYSEGNPAKMYLRVLRDPESLRVGHFWERELFIPCDTDKIEYRYGIKERKNSMIRWERDSNRVFNFKDVKFYIDEQFDSFRDSMGVQSSTTSFTYKNSSYIRLDHSFIDDFIYSEVSEELWIGPYPKYEEIEKLKSKGCHCIMSLQTRQEMEVLLISPDTYAEICKKNGMAYCISEVHSMSLLDPHEVQTAASVLQENINQYKCVYLHCTNGLTRCVTVAILYYHLCLGYPIRRSFDMVISKRWRSEVTEQYINELINRTNSENNTLRKKDSNSYKELTN